MLKSTSFIFDGVPSETYNLMIYFLDDADNRELSFGTDVELIEDRLPKRISPIHYGVDLNKSMSFPLTFGSVEYLEDYDVDAILSWLTGHQQYKWLEFVDGDHYVRYKCHLNNMQAVYINGLPTAFTCDVECDSQFAYEYPTVNEYEISTTEAYIEYFNKSAYNGYLYPKLKFEFSDNCNSISILNESDNNREFKIDYFDRVVEESAKQTFTHNTTLSNEYAEDDVEADFISWNVNTMSHSGSFNDIIIGVINGSEVWVALPENGNIAIFTEDKGSTWHEASPSLPQVGNWTGCFGDDGFVAICTDDNSAIASYSQDGKAWTLTSIELPVFQKWNKVTYVKSDGFTTGQYLAIANNSTIAATSTNGYGWQSTSLPVAQEWRSAFSGNNTIVLVGGNENISLISTDCITWEEIELPKNAAWSTGCYGQHGFIMLADTFYGSGIREDIALRSTDARVWEVIDFPIGAWSDITFNNSTYLAVGDRQFAYSFDGDVWNINTLPAIANSITTSNVDFICPIGGNRYIISNSPSTVKSSFDVVLSDDESIDIDNIYITATIDNTASDTSYSSNGIKTLATHISESDDEEGEISGGNFTALITDYRSGTDIDGAMMSAVFNKNSRTVTIEYIVDTNHTSVFNAPLSIIVEYNATSKTDLGYNNLVVNFDNENQIITTNKDTLNMYQYFNRKFLRFIKGLNRLRIKTDSGTCKVTISSEFLRKVGGR